MAAYGGHVDAIRKLRRAKAKPCLAARVPDSNNNAANVPLAVAALHGYSEVVQDFINEVGIEGCGGARGGEQARAVATREQHMDVMRALTNAGVIDTGEAILSAARCDRERAAMHLLHHHEGRNTAGTTEYANTVGPYGTTPLFLAVGCSHSPRMIRLLVDAGADPTLPVLMANPRGGDGVFHNTPLALAKYLWLEKKIADGTEVTDEQKRMLEGTRPFFTCVEAVHAVSWLWANDAPSSARPVKGTSTTRTACGNWSLMGSFMKRGGGARRSKLAAIFRYSAKPSSIKFAHSWRYSANPSS
ncbi:unnamed protein product, partial [Ectocarpus sp. 13 AM-2016]